MNVTNSATVVQDPLGQRCLARINVGTNANIADMAQLLAFLHTDRPPGCGDEHVHLSFWGACRQAHASLWLSMGEHPPPILPPTSGLQSGSDNGEDEEAALKLCLQTCCWGGRRLQPSAALPRANAAVQGMLSAPLPQRGRALKF